MKFYLGVPHPFMEKPPSIFASLRRSVRLLGELSATWRIRQPQLSRGLKIVFLTFICQIWVIKLDPNLFMLTYIMKFMHFSIKTWGNPDCFQFETIPLHSPCMLHFYICFTFSWFWWHSKKLPTVPLWAWAKSSKAKVGCWSFERPWSTSFKTWSLETTNP